MSIGWTRGWNNYLKGLAKKGIHFGHNCWDDSSDARRKFNKLEKLGAEVYIQIENESSSPYRTKIKLPSSFIEMLSQHHFADAAEADADVLLYILTKMPPASSVNLKTKREEVPATGLLRLSPCYRKAACGITAERWLTTSNTEWSGIENVSCKRCKKTKVYRKKVVAEYV